MSSTPGLDETTVDPLLLHRVHAPLRYPRRRRHERHVLPLGREQLREHASEVVVVVVEEEDPLAGGPAAGHEVVGRQRLDGGVEGGRSRVPAPDAVGAPAGAGRDRDVVEAVAAHLVGVDLALQRDLDVRELRELGAAVVDDADPGGEPGQPRLAQHASAELAARLGEHDLVAALARAPSPPRARPGRRRRRAPSRPTPPGRKRSGCQPRRHSSPIDGFCVQRIGVDVQSPVTQTLQPMHSRMSSSRPSSIFTGRNGSAIEGRAAPIRSITPSRISRTIVSGDVSQPMPTTGFEVSCLSPRKCSSVQASCANREVRESSGQKPTITSQTSGSSPTSANSCSISGRSIPCSPSSSSTTSAARDRGASVALRERVLEHLAQETRAVLERPAVLVVAEVVAPREEVLERRQAVRRVDVDEVVARTQRPLRRPAGGGGAGRRCPRGSSPAPASARGW